MIVAHANFVLCVCFGCVVFLFGCYRSGAVITMPHHEFMWHSDHQNRHWLKLPFKARVAIKYLMAVALLEQPKFTAFLTEVVEAAGLEQTALNIGPIKKRERTIVKTCEDAGGDAFRILDFNRALVRCETPTAVVVRWV